MHWVYYFYRIYLIYLNRPKIFPTWPKRNHSQMLSCLWQFNHHQGCLSHHLPLCWLSSLQREQAHFFWVILADTAASCSKKIAQKSQKQILTDVDNSMKYLNSKKKKVAMMSDDYYSSKNKKKVSVGSHLNWNPWQIHKWGSSKHKVLQLIDMIVNLPSETSTCSFSTTSFRYSSISSDYVIRELRSLSRISSKGATTP